MSTQPAYKILFELIQETINVINEEHASLMENNLEKIKTILEKKEQLFSEIIKQQAAITSMLDQFPEKKEDFNQLVEELQQLSNRNSRIIQNYLQQLNKVINTIYGKEEFCYGKNGPFSPKNGS